MEKEHVEKTAAADKAIGFDFQYYYFLFRLLNLKTGETVGLEVLDDVHTELSNSRQILVQLKHSTKIKANGTTTNLTTLDIDLWKTLSNWSQVIADKVAGRETKSAQLKFVMKTDFLLVSNKSYNESNTVLKHIMGLQDGVNDLEELDYYFESLKKETGNEEIKKYIQSVFDLDAEIRGILFQHLDFDLGCNEIINKCKQAIKEKQIDESKIDMVFSSLDSQIREDNFIATKNKTKIIIKFEDFNRKYRRHFDIFRNTNLVIKKFIGLLPDRLSEQRFIQQLIDIQDIASDDLESMAKFTRYRLQMQNNIDEWYKSGDLIENEIEEFDNESITRWENEYRKVYRNCTEEEIQQKALELLDIMRTQKLPLASQELPTDMCNGQYYRLSDIPELGWHKTWEKRYK